jgi:hypothetical protein
LVAMDGSYSPLPASLTKFVIQVEQVSDDLDSN